MTISDRRIKWRSLLSLLLAVVLTFQLATPALAASATVSVLDGLITLTDLEGTIASTNDGVVTATVTGFTSAAWDNDVTLKSNADKKAELKFDYSIVGASSYTGFNSSSGTYTATIEAGAEIVFKIVAPAATTATLTMSNFSLTEVSDSANVTVNYDSTLGSVTMGSSTVASGTQVQGNATSGITLTAVAVQGMNFVGWVNDDTEELISTDATHTFFLTKDINVRAEFVRPLDPAKFIIDGGSTLYALQDALDAVGNANKTITLAVSGVLEAGTYNIPSNVKLLIPYKAYGNGYNGNFDEEPDTSSLDPQKTDKKANATLTLGAGTVINCAGKICVDGQVYDEAGNYTGVPTGDYGHIELSSESSQIIVNGGTLYCYGYITGAGDVIANSGTVYEVFQLLGWKGGGTTFAWYNNNQIKSFPLNDYAVQNIEADFTVNSGATAKGIATVKVSSIKKQPVVNYIGSGDGFVQLGNGASVCRSFTPATNRMCYTLYGNASVGSVNINITFTAAEKFILAIFAHVTDLDMNSANYILGIPYYMDFVAASGSTVTLKNNYKLLPGATLTAEGSKTLTTDTGTVTIEPAKVIVDGNLYIYDTADYVDQGYGTKTGKSNGNSTPVLYVASPGAPSSLPMMNSSTPSGQVVVNGTLEINGAIYTTEHRGTSVDKVLKGTGTVINNSQADTVVTNVLDEFTYNNGSVEDRDIRVLPVVGQISGLSVGSEYHAFSNGGTYKGTEDGYWYQYVITANDDQYIEKARTAATSAETKVENTVGIVGSGRKITYTNGVASSLTDATGTFKFHLNADVESVTYGDQTLTPGESGLYTLNNVTSDVALNIVAGPATNKSEVSDYQGKIISILGDGASAFTGHIPAGDSFNREHVAAYPANGVISNVNEMWWKQLITTLGANLGVNDSWDGSQVLNTMVGNSGNLGQDAALASMTRIQNLGSNGTPNVIIFFGGTHDILNGTKLTPFDSSNAPAAMDTTTAQWSSFTDAYVAAILRLKGLYPNSEILAVLPNVDNDKLDLYNSVMQEICDHYGIRTVDLRDKVAACNGYPNAAGMDAIELAIKDALLKNYTVEAGATTVHSVTHSLNLAKASKSHYTAVSHGASFQETLSGKNLQVTVTMGGVDITADCYVDGVINVSAVTGDLVINVTAEFDLGTYLQQLPTPAYDTTNLWNALIPDQGYYSNGSWNSSAYSITIPVEAGQKIWATSFGKAGENGSNQNGIDVTWFLSDGTAQTMSAYDVYNDTTKFDGITAPANAIAINIPMWNSSSDNAVYNLSLPILYSDFYSAHLQQIPANATRETDLWKLLTLDEYLLNSERVWAKQDVVRSVTVPISEGDRIAAKSFGEAGTNGGTANGIRVTWLSRDGILKSMSPTEVYTAYSTGGCLVAPAGAVAVNVCAWTSENEFYILTLPKGPNFVADNSKYDGHLQQIPENTWCTDNLWTVLKPEGVRYTGTAWSIDYPSITIPVQEGDKIKATSFGAAGTNGHTQNGIRVVWFCEDGRIVNLSLPEVYAEYSKYGYLKAPKDAVAVNIPMWTATGAEAYLLTLPSKPEDFKDETKFIEHLQEIDVPVYSTTNLWSLLTPEDEYYTASGWGKYTGVKSVTIRVKPGDKLRANSLRPYPENEHPTSATNGIRVTWFFDDGRDPDTQFRTAPKNGYIVAPEGAVAVNIPVWNGSNANNYLYNLSLPISQNYADHVQQFPANITSQSNLWDLLIPETSYYDSTEKFATLATVTSITFPVSGGDRVFSNAYGTVEENFNTYNGVDGIRVTWFFNDGTKPLSLSPTEIHTEYTAKGYIEAPANAVAVCTSQWVTNENNWVKLTRFEDIPVEPEEPEEPVELHDLYKNHLQQLPKNIYRTTNLWTALANRESVYYMTTVNDTETPYNANLWGVNSNVHSVTIPVQAGDKVYASSLTENGGIRITWFFDDGENVTYLSWKPADANARFLANTDEATGKHYIKPPEGAIAVNVAMWNGSDSNKLYLLNAPADPLTLNGLPNHLVQLPDPCYNTTNIWAKLRDAGKLDTVYYTGSDVWGNDAGNSVRSVTIPVNGGDRINAYSFGSTPGGNGIRIAWFCSDGSVVKIGGGDVYKEYTANQSKYLVAPEKAVAVCIPMWADSDACFIYNLDLPDDPYMKNGLSAHLSQLPNPSYKTTNLWAVLNEAAKVESEYYKGSAWGTGADSITIPVSGGDRIQAYSFGAAGSNGSATNNGIRVTWFLDDGSVMSLFPSSVQGTPNVHDEYSRNGYLTAPANAIAVNIPMWVNNDNCYVYNLDLPAAPSSNASDYKGKVISIMGDSISTFEGYIPVKDGFNLAHRKRYPDVDFIGQYNDVTTVEQTWWHQVITELDAKLGINDSWAGSRVNNTQDTHSGDLGPDAAMASMTRILNLGANGTPDVILVFGGTNDSTSGLSSYDISTAPTPENVSLTDYKWSSLAESYAVMIARMRRFYPDTEIVAILPYDGEAKTTNPVLADICEHYGVPYVDLWEETDIRINGGYNEVIYDTIHPTAKTMDVITDVVLDVLYTEVEMTAGENKVHPIAHTLTDVIASKHYYKGVSEGAQFEETLTFEGAANVVVTMNGEDITASAYDEQNKKITITSVTGNVVITASVEEEELTFADRVQPLPSNVYKDTNLWTELRRDPDHYSANDVWEGPYSSITFPVVPGEHIWSTSFGAAGTNGNSSTNGIRVTWFDAEYNMLDTWAPGVVYEKFQQNGYLIVPTGAAYVNVPAWNNDGNVVKIVSRPTVYDGHVIENMPENICCDTNVWNLLESQWEDVYWDHGNKQWAPKDNLRSITIPISAEEKIYSSAFGTTTSLNGATNTGICVTWFGADGIIASDYIGADYGNLAADGTVTAPTGVVAVNLSVWDYQVENTIRITTRDHAYSDATCKTLATCHCGATTGEFAEHNWNEGECDVCQTVCQHSNYVDGVCSDCGMAQPQEEFKPVIGNGKVEGAENQDGSVTVDVGKTAITIAAPADGWKEGENTFTVSSTNDIACVVLVLSDGNYRRLTAGEAVNGAHSFNATLAEGDQIVVAVKGDLGCDGTITAREARYVLQASSSMKVLSNLEIEIADLDGNGEITAREARYILQASSDMKELAW